MKTTEEQIQNYMRYKRDPLAFLTECVYTQDAVDEVNPVKLWPGDREYLQFFVRMWQREKKLIVPKSRRMTMSWTCIPLALWDLIFNKNKNWAFVSKKEQDSAELVERALFTFNRIPPDKVPPQLLPGIKGGKMTQSPPRITFEFGNGDVSKLEGFPMGADQLRQFTFSGIFGDEAAFWPEAEKFYSAAKPTTDGGGRMVLVSSRSPGFFKKIVFDKINFKGDTFAEAPPVPPKYPMQGIEVWKNPDNGFAVMDIHYTADPAKRDPAFQKAIRASMPEYEYLREYEKQWDSFSGLPVYPNFRKDIHIAKKSLEPHLGLPLLLGWDFGLTPAAVVCQLQGNSLKVLREYVSKNEGINTFAPMVLKDLQLRYREWTTKDMINWIDPAGFQRVQTDARTCAGEMTEAGVKNIEPGPVAWEPRRVAVEEWILSIDKQGAGLEVDPLNCPTMISGFSGGYRYADSQSEIESQKPRPLKNHFSHPHDAFQYVAWGAAQKTQQATMAEIPSPIYGFQKEPVDLQQRSSTGERNYGRTSKKFY